MLSTFSTSIRILFGACELYLTILVLELVVLYNHVHEHCRDACTSAATGLHLNFLIPISQSCCFLWSILLSMRCPALATLRKFLHVTPFNWLFSPHYRARFDPVALCTSRECPGGLFVEDSEKHGASTRMDWSSWRRRVVCCIAGLKQSSLITWTRFSSSLHDFGCSTTIRAESHGKIVPLQAESQSSYTSDDQFLSDIRPKSSIKCGKQNTCHMQKMARLSQLMSNRVALTQEQVLMQVSKASCFPSFEARHSVYISEEAKPGREARWSALLHETGNNRYCFRHRTVCSFDQLERGIACVPSKAHRCVDTSLTWLNFHQARKKWPFPHCMVARTGPPFFCSPFQLPAISRLNSADSQIDRRHFPDYHFSARTLLVFVTLGCVLLPLSYIVCATMGALAFGLVAPQQSPGYLTIETIFGLTAGLSILLGAHNRSNRLLSAGPGNTQSWRDLSRLPASLISKFAILLRALCPRAASSHDDSHTSSSLQSRDPWNLRVVSAQRLRHSLTLVWSLLAACAIFASHAEAALTVTAISSVNTPTVGGTTLTIHGSEFDAADGGRVGLSTCESSTWISNTALLCVISTGFGQSLSVQLTTNTTDTFLGAFSYDVAQISAQHGVNFAPTAGTDLTVMGINLGAVGTSAQASISSTATATTTWISDSALVCKSSRGIGPSLRTVVTTGLQVSTTTETQTYDSSAVSSRLSTNQNSLATNEFTIHGTNFGTFDHSANGDTGQSTNEKTEWQTDRKSVV